MTKPSRRFADRKTIFIQKDQNHSNTTNDFYLYMLMQDVQNQILPMRVEGKICLEPTNQKLEQRIIDIFVNHGDYSYTNISDAISNFISQTAGLLTYWGEINYEIVEELKVNDLITPTFRLLLIQSKLIRIFSQCFQLIPKKLWQENKKVLLKIPLKSIWTFRIPQQLGGLRKHRKMIINLRHAGVGLPKFVEDGLNKKSQNEDYSLDFGVSGFNYSEYHKLQKIMVARESAKWGWPVRFMFDEDTLPFYRVYRQIKFSQTLAIFRDFLLSEINNFLKQELGSAKLVYKNIPSYSDLEKTEEDLINNKITIEKAYKLIRLYHL